MVPKTISSTGVGQSAWYPVDWRQGPPFNLSLHAIPGGNTISVEYTPDDPASASPAVFSVTGMTGLTSNTAGNIAFPVRAVRINQTAGAGTSSLIILQA